MRYISLFSGIGGMELGIEKIFPNAKCIAHSEIDPNAIELYSKHFHSPNLGNICNIHAAKFGQICKIEKVDLIVAGFPCTDLTSLARLNGPYQGLNGQKSKLFYVMTNLLTHAKKNVPNIHIIIENNASMTTSEKNKIWNTLFKIFGDALHETLIDSALFTIQKRRRLFWTTFDVSLPNHPISNISWKNILLPVDKINKLNIKRCIHRYNQVAKNKNKTKHKHGKIAIEIKPHIYTFKQTNEKTNWNQCSISNTEEPRSHTFTSGGFGAYMLCDHRGLPKGQYRIRRYALEEVEKLFGFPPGYSQHFRFWKAAKLYGRAVVVPVISHIVSCMKNFNNRGS
jgi:DNA-cytosine methyltransferase